MERRRFIRQGLHACAALAAIPALASLEGCASAKGLTATVADGAVRIPASALADKRFVTVNAKGHPDPLLVVKEADGSYRAVVLNCPHKGGPVSEKGGELVCGWHDSRFTLDGKVTEGPSKKDLQTYPVEQEGDQLRIALG